MKASGQPKLCVSLLPESAKQLAAELADCEQADLVEIRLDYIPGFKWAQLATGKPVIATLRTREQGGFWEGPVDKYLAVIRKAMEAAVAYVDIEFRLAAEVLPQLKSSKSAIVLSHHTSETGYTILADTLRRMSEMPATVYKLIIGSQGPRDNRTALKLIELANELGITYVIHAIGEEGRSSRLLGAVRGNAWTYVSRGVQDTTAPGQISVFEATQHYFLPEKQPDTRLLGLAGWPVTQSRGWRLHNLLIHRKIPVQSGGPSYLYTNFPVENFEAFWSDWQEQLHGLSVTIPHKERITEFLDEMSTEVKISGVCNTAVRVNGKWRGYNTDLIAIETLLRPWRDQLRNGGVIIGTGATARSAIAALKRLDISPIFVVGRNAERGAMLVSTMGVDFLNEDETHYANTSCVIQTTPVGMFPQVDQYPVGTSLFRKERVVLDVVYNPVETRFLRIAGDRGCDIISGVEMFLLQAARQLELFTGIPVTAEEVRTVWNEIT